MQASPAPVEQEAVIKLTNLLVDYSCHQSELLMLLRRVSSELIRVAPAWRQVQGPESQAVDPSPLGALIGVAGADQRSPTDPNLNLAASEQAGPWSGDILGSSVRPTTRTYDYFNSLDQQIEALRPSLAPD